MSAVRENTHQVSDEKNHVCENWDKSCQTVQITNFIGTGPSIGHGRGLKGFYAIYVRLGMKAQAMILLASTEFSL